MTYKYNSKFDLQLSKAYELNLQIISWSKSDLQLDIEFEFGRHHHFQKVLSLAYKFLAFQSIIYNLLNTS